MTGETYNPNAIVGAFERLPTDIFSALTPPPPGTKSGRPGEAGKPWGTQKPVAEGEGAQERMVRSLSNGATDL
jgi:hypothetical protein